jgi:hypothetical protein
MPTDHSQAKRLAKGCNAKSQTEQVSIAGACHAVIGSGLEQSRSRTRLIPYRLEGHLQEIPWPVGWGLCSLPRHAKVLQRHELALLLEIRSFG